MYSLLCDDIAADCEQYNVLTYDGYGEKNIVLQKLEL